MISFIEFAEFKFEFYATGPADSLCEKGMIDNPLECEKAANQLNFHFETDEEVPNVPGGCYMWQDVEVSYYVYFNKNLNGTSCESCRPICGQGK